MDRYHDKIRQLIPINQLTVELQAQLLEQARIVEYSPETHVFHEGDSDQFALYVLEGEVELSSQDETRATHLISGGTQEANYALAQLQPRRFSAKATRAAKILQIDQKILAHSLSMASASKDNAIKVEQDAEDKDWISKVLQSGIFARMPPLKIQQLFTALKPIATKAGQTVFQQGDVGDDYYMIGAGYCAVLRKSSPTANDVKLAQLGPGDGFGEEALITNAKRSATIKMETDGTLMCLTKQDFIELVTETALEGLSLEAAKDLHAKGAIWLDVRYPNEHKQSAIPDSINFPLHLIHSHSSKLETGKKYISYCDIGARGAVGAFLLVERGYEAYYLENGLADSEFQPQEDTEEGATTDPPLISDTPPTTPLEGEEVPMAIVEEMEDTEPDIMDQDSTTIKEKIAKMVEATIPGIGVEKDSEQSSELDGDTTASIPSNDINSSVHTGIIEAKLEDTQTRIKQAEQIIDKQEVGEELQHWYNEIKQDLEKNRQQLEQERQLAEKEFQARTEAKERRLQQMKEAAKNELQEKQKELESLYEEHAKKMAEMQKSSEESAKHLEDRRKQIEQNATLARENVGETEELKRRLEEAYRLLELQKQQQKQEQVEQEKRLQASAKAMIEEEKKKLVAQYQCNNQQFENLKKEKLAMEAAKQEAKYIAKQEVERAIQAFTLRYAKAQASEEQQMQAERVALEQKEKQVKEKLEYIAKEKKKIEHLREKERTRANQLKAIRDKEKASSRPLQRLQEQLNTIEDNITLTEKKLEAVNTTQKRAEITKHKIDQRLLKKRQQETHIKQKIALDLAAWKATIQEGGNKAIPSNTLLRSRKDFVRRMNQKTNQEKAKKEAIEQDLLKDISQQLKDEF